MPQIIKMSKPPTDIYYQYCRIPRLGLALIASTDEGICHLSFIESKSNARKYLQNHFPYLHDVRHIERSTYFIETAVEALHNFKQTSKVRLHLKGSAFQFAVWRALTEIPRGQTRFYAQIAKAINRPMAIRATASAIASNGVALLVPCHRVILKSGNIGQYRWGVERKKLLLKMENIN